MPNEEFEDLTRGNVVARRNQLVGLWAGKQMGLAGDALERYIESLHEADYKECGSGDVANKVMADLAHAGMVTDIDAVQDVISRAQSAAHKELLCTD